MFDVDNKMFINLETDYLSLPEVDALLFPDKLKKKQPFFIKTMSR